MVARTPAIEIDAGLVAPRLGLTLAEFRQLMDQHRITILCERGVGEDAGRYRASFYYGDRRVRLVVNVADQLPADHEKTDDSRGVAQARKYDCSPGLMAAADGCL